MKAVLVIVFFLCTIGSVTPQIWCVPEAPEFEDGCTGKLIIEPELPKKFE